MRPLISSVETTARWVMEPRPVRYISSMPLVPTMLAPEGKSGPLMRSRHASSSSGLVASGLDSSHWTALATSRRLCGGMLVAIPTAIPEEPLTSRFGNREGKMVGSVAVLRSEEHTSELQSRGHLVCRLLLEKEKSE